LRHERRGFRTPNPHGGIRKGIAGHNAIAAAGG
jgi:hypothetical protein